MLAQAVHFARERMLTDANGHKVRLDEDTLRERLRFPLMTVHGRQNRVFDWQGSMDGHKPLKESAQEAAQQAGTGPGTPAAGSVNYGERTATQLLILEG